MAARKQRKRMMDFDGKLSEEADRLNRYLYQYRDCISRKQTLERRKEEFRKEFTPVKSPKIDGLPRGGTVGEGIAVALVIKLDEIDEKILEQTNHAAKLLSDIINIIDLLPEHTPEDILSKSIIENRYIDRMGWDKVCRENHASRSKVTRYWKRGLYTLTGFKKVKKILKEYEEKEKDDAAKD